MKASHRFGRVRRLGSWLWRLFLQTLQSPQMTNYTGFGLNGLATGQFGAIGRGHLLRLPQTRASLATEPRSELRIERDWGWI